MVSSRFLANITANATGLVSLPTNLTNGNATYGLLSHQTCAPKFLPSYPGPLKCGAPWGCRTVEHTNSYTDFPNTGVHRNYDFTIERGFLAPDGVNRSMILINGQFPAPLIEANWGDTINVKVHNRISGPEEGTSLHWHGLNQKPTPWYDGVPSVQQCPIAPDADFEYSFVATNYGSSWYHSHYSAQYAGGIFGPMVIYGPVQQDIEYDCDLGAVMLSDAYHQEYFELVGQTMTTTPGGSTFPSANNLIQGKAAFACPTNGSKAVTCGANEPNPPQGCTPNANVAKFQVTRGKKYRLRLINTSAEAAQRFSIDGHNLTVIANDFVPLVPYTAEVITLGVGQRSDVVLEANADFAADSAFWMRSNVSCNMSLPGQKRAQAALYYEDADTGALPSSAATPYDDAAQLGNDPLNMTEPAFAIAVQEKADLTLNVTIGLANNGSGVSLFYMNNSSFRADYNDPLLLEARLGHTSFPDDPQWNVYNTGEARTVRIILNANVSIAHPMHLHGHDFYVLAQGNGTWDGNITRPSNPQRRDVQLLPKVGDGSAANRPYIVLQFDQDNPGVWPFHCHIAWHVSAGLYLNIMERPKDITQLQIPEIMAQSCRAWWNYTGHNVVDEIDSGL